MEHSPYLQALQRIPGVTSAKKHRELTAIAQTAIREWTQRWGRQIPIEVFPSPQLREPLIPWVMLEIGRILKMPHLIDVGLVSEDSTLFFRALKAKWLFRNIGTFGYPDVEHFRVNIFPYLSLRKRCKLIKTLAAHLTDPKKVETFYNIITKFYGYDHARPFLKNCSEPFIWDCINSYRVRLTYKEMIYLFSKNPLMVIEYLHRLDEDDFRYEVLPNTNYRHRSQIKVFLRRFLPRLLKNYSSDFSKLVAKHRDVDILLKNHETFLFLKKERLALFHDPHLYFPKLSLKKVTSILPKSQLGTIIKKFLPADLQNFNFMDVYEMLEHMFEDQKIPFIMKIFKENYSEEFTKYRHCVVPALKYFEPEDRSNLARKLILEQWDGIKATEEEIKTWRCYLSLQEAFSMIRYDIDHCLESEKLELFKQLVTSCAMNEYFVSVFDALKHMSLHFTSSQTSAWMEIFDHITAEFDIGLEIATHWKELYEFVFFSNLRTGSFVTVGILREIVVWGITRDLISDRLIDEKIIVLTEINEVNSTKPQWNICKNNHYFERKCLEHFIPAVYLVYESHRKRNSSVWKNVIVTLVSAMYEFNHRYGVRKKSIKLFSLKHHSRLKNDVHKLLQRFSKNVDNFNYSELITLLMVNEPQIIEPFLPFIDFCGISEATIKLKRDKNFIHSILTNWEVYYKKCKQNIFKKQSQLFLRTIRWFNYLPRRFVEKAIQEINKSIATNKEFDKNALKILAILFEGLEMKNIIIIFMRRLSDGVVQNIFELSPLIVEQYDSQFLAIAETVKYMRFPFPMIDCKHLYEPKFTAMIAEYLTGLGRRLPLHVMILFLKRSLPMTERVIFYLVKIVQNVFNTEDLQEFLLNLWISNHDNVQIIRLYLIQKIHETFIARPMDSTWLLMQRCLNDLNTKDHPKAFSIIAYYRRINKKYIAGYIEKVLTIFANVEGKINLPGPLSIVDYIPHIIGSLSADVTEVFPESLHEFILTQWLINENMDPKTLKSSMNYLVDCYIMPAQDDLLVKRIKFFCAIFREVLQYYLLDCQLDSQTPRWIFVHAFFGEFITYVIFLMPFNKTKTMLVNATRDTFLEVLKPSDEIPFILYLELTTLFEGPASPQEIAKRVNGVLESIVDQFTLAILCAISNYLFNLISAVSDDEMFVLEFIKALTEKPHQYNTLVGMGLVLKMSEPKKESFQKSQQTFDYRCALFKAIKANLHLP